MSVEPPFAAFLRALRRRGLTVTIEDHVALTKLLAADARWDLRLLEERMMYVLARSRDEQARFKDAFREAFGTTPAIVDPPKRRRSPYWLLLGAIVAAVMLAVVLRWGAASFIRAGFGPPPPADAPVPPVDPPNGTRATGEEGLMGPPKTPRTYNTSLELRTLDVSWSELSALSALLSIPLVLGVMLSLRARRRRLFPDLPRPYTFELAYPDLSPRALDPIELEDLALTLRGSPSRLVLGELDPARTARTTASSGIPTLVWATRRSKRRHLVLLSTDPRFGGPRAHFEALLDELDSADVEIERYDFSGSAARIFSRNAPDATFPTSLLVGQFDTLTVLSDPDLATKLVTTAIEGRVHPPVLMSWLRELEAFEVRLWLSPSVGRTVSPTSAALEAAGWTVKPLGLAAFYRLSATSPTGTVEGSTDQHPAGPSRARDAVAFYADHLGEAFPLLCASTVLPSLSQEGVRFLLQSVGAHVPWESAARLLGLPWLLDGQWPVGLEASLRNELHLRYAELRRQSEALVAKLLSSRRPESGSAAELAHGVMVLEHELRQGNDPVQAFRRLADSSEQVRERLRRSPLVQRWLEQHGFDRLRLRTAGEASLFVVLVLALFGGSLLGARTLEPTLSEALKAANGTQIDGIRASLGEILSDRSLRCWRSRAEQSGRAFAPDTDPPLATFPFEVTVSQDGGFSPHEQAGRPAVLSPDPIWLACLKDLPTRADFRNPLKRELGFVASVSLPRLVAQSQIPPVAPTSPGVAAPSPPPAPPSMMAAVPPKPSATPPVDHCGHCLTRVGNVGSFESARAPYRLCGDPSGRAKCTDAARSTLRSWMSTQEDRPTGEQCVEREKLADAARVLGVSEALITVRMVGDCLAVSASPEPPAPTNAKTRDAYARHFVDLGVKAYEAGNYTEALAAYQKAQDQSPRTEVLLNIALTYERLGNLKAAMSVLEAYVASPGADRIEWAREELKRLQRMRAATIKAPDAPPPGIIQRPPPKSAEAPAEPADEAPAADGAKPSEEPTK